MRPSGGLAALLVVAGCGLLATCVYPTERDSAVHVSVTPLKILIRGTDTTATATAWRRIGPADSQPIPNVVFVWSSSDPGVAAVDARGHITGIKSGTARIRAAAANFDAAASYGEDTLRVAAPLEVDSVRPATVRFGARLAVYGVGADSILLASLAGVPLVPVPFSAVRDGTGYGRREFWVPAPARSDQLFFAGSGIFGQFPDSTRVLPQDIYEPDDTIPYTVDLDTSRPFPGTSLNFLLFFNPALAFEPLKRGETVGADWYHFTQTSARDVTIVLTAPSVAGTFSTFLTDSLGWDGTNKRYIIGRDSWTFGPRSHACHGLGFSPAEANGDSTIVAFKGLPAAPLDGIALYAQPGPYGLAVIEGYVSELPADAHEDDNSCTAAEARGPVPLPFRDTLAIENPHDVDWIFFTLSAPAAVTARVAPLPSAKPDSLKDLDLYLIRKPAPGATSLTIVGADTSAAATAAVVAALAAGEYYAAVIDFAGTSTPYAMCIDTGLTPCAGFPAPPLRARPAPPARSPRPRARGHVSPSTRSLLGGRPQ
jgi:hypothetical protein